MRKVLLVAYYFPPAGGSAVQRILGMVRHLPAFGWSPTVLTSDPETSALPSREIELLDGLPGDLAVHRVSGFEPHTAYARWMGRSGSDPGVGFISDAQPGARERLARWIRANVFVPDARVAWSLSARAEAARLMRSDAFDAVLTSGPPHSVHLVGRAVASRFGTPWLADFRDLWPDPSYAHHLPVTAPVRALDGWLRRRVLDSASAVVAVSRVMAETLASETRTPVHVVENGFETADFEGIRPDTGGDCVVLHAGSLTSERNPHVLWNALRRVVRERGGVPLTVELLGDVDARVIASVRDAGLEQHVRVVPSVPHGEAVNRMASATALLLSVPRVDGAEGIVTGKVFEYIGAGRPIVGIGPVDGEAARIIHEAGAGELFGYEDDDGMAAFLDRLIGAWERGRPMPGAPAGQASRFSRRARAGQIAEILDRDTFDRNEA